MDRTLQIIGSLLMNSTVVEISMAALVFTVAWFSSCRRHHHCHFAADLLVVSLLGYQVVEHLLGMDMARPFWMAIDGVGAVSCAVQWSESRKPWWMLLLSTLFVAQMAAHLVFAFVPHTKLTELRLHISVNVIDFAKAILVAGWPLAERQFVVLRRLVRARRRRRRFVGGMAQRPGGDLSVARAKVERR